MKYCENCGYKMEDNAAFCENCGKAEVVQQSYGAEKSSKKSTAGKIIAAVVAVILMIVGKFVGGAIGEMAGRNMAERHQMNEIESYIESSEEYVPGYFNDAEYVSEHFGFKFVVDENWVMYTEEELEPASEELRKSTIDGMLQSIEGNASDEIIAKIAEAIYAEQEMGAACISDGMIVGETAVAVLGCYGLEEMSGDDIVDALKSGILKVADNATSGIETIAEKVYDTIEVNMTVDGVDLVNKFYVYEKDGMVCMMTCRAMEEYEDMVFDSFEGNISTYNA